MCCFNITDNSHKLSQLIHDIQAQLDKISLSRIIRLVWKLGQYLIGLETRVNISVIFFFFFIEIIVRFSFSLFAGAYVPSCLPTSLGSHTMDLLTQPLRILCCPTPHRPFSA